MKKGIFILLIALAGFTGNSQLIAQSPNDSVKITLSVQAKDLEFFASYLFEKPEYEDLYDSVKIAFRGKGNPPQGNTAVPITAIAGDWFRVYQSLIHNELAWHSGTKTRFENLPTAAAAQNPFITDKLASLTAYFDNSFTEARRQGRQKLRRTKQ
jgi:hypothetical protein